MNHPQHNNNNINKKILLFYIIICADVQLLVTDVLDKGGFNIMTSESK